MEHEHELEMERRPNADTTFSRIYWVIAAAVAALLASASVVGCATPEPTTKAGVKLGTLKSAMFLPGRSSIKFHFDEYFFNQGFHLYDDRNYRVQITIGSESKYLDLEPGCCSGQWAVVTPRNIDLTTFFDVPNQRPGVAIKVEMFEHDGSNDRQLQDLVSGQGEAMQFSYQLANGRFSGDVDSDVSCPGVGDPRDGCRVCSNAAGNGLCFTISVANDCAPNATVASMQDFGIFGNTCNGKDDDCDGTIDEDFVPEPPPCGACSESTSCSPTTGVTRPCAEACGQAPMINANWAFLGTALDFGVGNDKLCYVAGLPAGPDISGGISCGSVVAEAHMFPREVMNLPASFTAGCSPTSLCTGNKVAVGPEGRVWGSASDGIYAHDALGTWLRIADPPPNCTGLVSEIGMMGAPTTAFLGAGAARLFARCGALLSELNLTTATWTDYVLQTHSFGASPSIDDVLYLVGTRPDGGPGHFQHDDQLVTPAALLPLVSFDTKVGGVYAIGANPFDPACDSANEIEALHCRYGKIFQISDGFQIRPVADLGRPLELPTGAGKYPHLIAPVTINGNTQNFVPRKIAEGGPLGDGGPPLFDGRQDVVWVLNNTFRLYAYFIEPLPLDLSNDLGGDDIAPRTARFVQFGGGDAPVAVCKDIQLTAGESCTAMVAPTAINGGSFDPDGTPLTLSLLSPSSVGLGSNSVTLQVSDGLSTDTCVAEVTVVDETPPSVVGPDDVFASGCGSTLDLELGVATATDNCGSVVSLQGAIVELNGVPLASPIDVTGGSATLEAGGYLVRWTASDGVNVGAGLQHIEVTGDPNPPELTAPPDLTEQVCQSSETINVGQASAIDDCPVTVTGQVVSWNGNALAAPIDVIDGEVTLGVGTHVVEWTADDGENSTLAQQTVLVGTTIQAGHRFHLADNAALGALGAENALFNSGSGSTHVGNDARVSDIQSVAGVQIQHRVTTGGSIVSGGSVTSQGSLSATVTEFGDVQLPPLPTLPPFPAGGEPSFIINAGDVETPVPGDYGDVTLNSGGTLVLGDGDYTFTSLIVNSNTTLQATSATSVFVLGEVAYRSPFVDPDGALQPVTLLLGSSTSVRLEERFSGVIIAPQAQVVFGIGSGLDYVGSFFARELEVNPGSSLICSPSGQPAVELPTPGFVASLVATADWGSGFCQELVLDNQSQETVTDWSVVVNLGGASVFTSWNGAFTAATGESTVSAGFSWNETFAPGASSNAIGFCADRPGSDTSLLAGVVSVDAQP